MCPDFRDTLYITLVSWRREARYNNRKCSKYSHNLWHCAEQIDWKGTINTPLHSLWILQIFTCCVPTWAQSELTQTLYKGTGSCRTGTVDMCILTYSSSGQCVEKSQVPVKVWNWLCLPYRSLCDNFSFHQVLGVLLLSVCSLLPCTCTFVKVWLETWLRSREICVMLEKSTWPGFWFT